MQSSEYLSLFLDEYLKNGTKSQTESEVDSLLDKGLVLLQYIADKDRFEQYYKKHMAKRLLMKRSSRDMERQMVSKMKTKIGTQITQRLEGMIKDVDISENLATQYRDYCANSQDPEARTIDIEARVITSNTLLRPKMKMEVHDCPAYIHQKWKDYENVIRNSTWRNTTDDD